MTIWVNEQLDPAGLLYCCIASVDEQLAKDCHESFEKNLSEAQKAMGWVARLRKVDSWDEVPVNSLKLD
ncbi:glycogen debranching protein [Merismopedia glauca]|uniref:Glycogen debranching protein n=1 Tax=Merismopedia glauca CCAP 1448/3 TaxID=1296344 RepID=A0A2T1C788_9CYAN|nr:glycogen debranching protein [Merismopedia glauca]PSB04028.1 glycogen debranching protein [Merismopedia glauca CCAP 1448/3]